MSLRWHTIERCPECGNDKDVAVPLIEALLTLRPKDFGADVEEGIAELQGDVARFRQLAERYVTLCPDRTEIAKAQLARAFSEIEKQAAAILKIRDI